MTQRIIETLNLPSLEDALREHGLLPDEQVIEDEPPMAPSSEDVNPGLSDDGTALRRIDLVEGSDHANAMDKIHEETLKHAQDMMDLGYNVDMPRQRGIFEIATMMYARAIEAKNSKRDAQLKTMKLALDQRKLDLDEKKLRHEIGEQTVNAGVTVTMGDRNEILKRMREHKNQSK